LPQRKVELHAQAEEVVFALAFSDFRLYFVFMQTNRLHAQQLVDHDLEGGVFLAILLIISIEQERCKIRLPSRALQLARVGWQCFELVFLVECFIVNRDALQSRISCSNLSFWTTEAADDARKSSTHVRERSSVWPLSGVGRKN
jgi:hypothetical protein